MIALDRSVEKSTNGSLHMWKMRSLEHTDISTHSMINLFSFSCSPPPLISLTLPPIPLSLPNHMRLIFFQVAACVSQTKPLSCLFVFCNEVEQRLSVYIMFSKSCEEGLCFFVNKQTKTPGRFWQQEIGALH